jgi:DNA-binding MarR family transcriptional regulator
MWVLLRPPQFGGAQHANDYDNRSRYRQVGIPGSRSRPVADKSQQFAINMSHIVSILTIRSLIIGTGFHMASSRDVDRDRSRDLVVLKSGMPIKRIATPLARRFAQICTAALADMTSEADLTPLQYAARSYLSDEPDIDQNGLAARLGVDRTSVGQLVDQMESNSLVERRVNGADRRARLLRLSRRGSKLRDRLRPKAHLVQARLLGTLTPTEREILLELLVRVIDANESYARPGAGRRKPAISTSGSSSKK